MEGKTMEKIYQTSKALKMSDETTFDNGYIPETGQMFQCDIEFKAEKTKQLIENIKDFFGVDDEALLLNSCDDIGRIDVQLLENEAGEKASEWEIKDWKNKGCVQLYACTYSFIVEKHLIEPVDFENLERVI